MKYWIVLISGYSNCCQQNRFGERLNNQYKLLCFGRLRGNNYAEQYRIHYIETSAKTGQFFDQVFQQMAMRIQEKIESKLIDQKKETLGIKLGTFYRNDEEDDKELQKSLGQREKKKNDNCC